MVQSNRPAGSPEARGERFSRGFDLKISTKGHVLTQTSKVKSECYIKRYSFEYISLIVRTGILLGPIFLKCHPLKQSDHFMCSE